MTTPTQPMSDGDLATFDETVFREKAQVRALRERLRVAEAKGRELDRILSATTIEGDGIPYWVDRLIAVETELQAARAVCEDAKYYATHVGNTSSMWAADDSEKRMKQTAKLVKAWRAIRGDK